MSGNYNYFPCTKCEGQTQSSSGYCIPCRTFVCACGIEFTSQKFGVTKCTECRKARDYKGKTFGRGVV